MNSLENIKSEIENKVNYYFENETRTNREPGMFGELTGKLRASKDILENAGHIAIEVANKYHEDLDDDQVEELKQFIKNLLPSAYKEWFLSK
jgi:hypothetical protein